MDDVATSAARKIIFTPTLTSAAGGRSSASSSHLVSKSEQYQTNKLPRLQQQPAVDDISSCYQVSLQPRPALPLSIPLPLFLSSSSASHTHTHTLLFFPAATLFTVPSAYCHHPCMPKQKRDEVGQTERGGSEHAV